MITRLSNYLLRLRHFCAICCLLVFATGLAQAQGTRVSGKVVEEGGGEPLPGVSILIKGTTNGVVSDFEGAYSISVPADATLIFSFIGYEKQEVSVNNRSVVDVQMPLDVQSLEEVVVVGYGAQKKSDVTGALIAVDESKIAEVPAAADVTSALQGRMSGVQITNTSSRPGASPMIRIRGNRSLGSDESGVNNPLIVLDGIPYSGNLTDINPSDIKSVSVLKDASATAIYGSRGANGVILVTTKRGKPGQTRFSYNGYTGVSMPLDKYDLMNGEEYATLKQYADADMTSAEIESLKQGRSTDWQDLMMQNGVINNHNLSFSGGNESTQYAVSVGYFGQSTVFPGQEYERYSLKTSLDQQINSWLKVGINTINSISYRDGESVSPMWNMMTLSPLYNAYDENGNINETPAVGSLDPNTVNPLVLYREESFVETRRRIRTFNTGYVEIAFPVEGLSYRLNAGLDYRDDEYGRFYSAMTPMQNINSGNSAAIRNSDTWSYTIENLLRYDRTFGDHTINFTGLFSVQEQEANQSGVNATGVVSDINQFYNLELAANTTIPSDVYYYNRWGLMSYMARLNYNYKDKYVATVTVRADGSSRLAEDNRWFTYPAFALAWNVHNESFLQGNTTVSNLRVRAGYGKTSNQAVVPYASLGGLSDITYNFGSDGGLRGYYVSDLPNENLGWEFTNSLNAGIDFGFFTNRITGSVDVYKTQTSDVLQARNLPVTSGITGSFDQNIGETEGKGIELMLSGEILDAESRDQLSLGFDFNFTAHQEKIVSLVDTISQDVSNGWFVGEAVNVLYDYEKIGIWQLDEADEAATYGPYEVGDIRVKDQNDDGLITEADRTILGQLDPKWTFGLTLRAGYQGFDFSVVTYGMFGHQIVSTLYQMNSSSPYNSLEGRRNGPDVDYWTEDNPTNEYPRVGLNSTRHGSTTGYFSGDFMKIRSINLGYTIPQTVLDKVGIQSARVYITADNPFQAFFSEYVQHGGIDPEPTGRGTENNITPGLGRRLVVTADTPPLRSFMIGASLTF